MCVCGQGISRAAMDEPGIVAGAPTPFSNQIKNTTENWFCVCSSIELVLPLHAVAAAHTAAASLFITAMTGHTISATGCNFWYVFTVLSTTSP